MSLRIQLLGQTRITHDGSSVDLPGYRPLALLAYLILTRKAYSREHLIDLLFDGPDDPRASLRWTLSKLRKAIGGEYILADREEISFNFQSDYWLDVTAFEAGETELYQGDLLEGLYVRDALRFEDWLQLERQRLRGQYQADLERELEIHQRQGDLAAVIITAQQLLKLDYLREDWHRLLMEAYARSGKRAAALEQYEKCRQALRKEWDVEPAPETVNLWKAIQSGQLGSGAVSIASNIPLTQTAPVANGSAEQQVGGLIRRPRRTLPWLVWVLVGAVLLVVAGVIYLRGPGNTAQLLGTTLTSTPAAPQEASPEAPAWELSGTTVRILGPFPEAQVQLFLQSMQPFEERTGIHIEFQRGDKPYEEYLATRMESGDLPDIANFPQPSWLPQLAEQGKIIDLRTFLDDAYLRQQYPDVFLNLATVDDRLLGIWHVVGVKSLVWYPKQAFDAQGYEVPETWEELIALSDRIVENGGTPWCIGINETGAQGWVGTDWVEDILLRTAPPETYDAWVRHDLPFNSPEIKRAFEIMGRIWLNDDYVYGGSENIAMEGFLDSPKHLFEDPPGCYLHKQASFAPFFFPEGVRYGEDYDFFYLPPIDPEFGKPVLGGGELMAMFNDRPEVREVMRYLTTAESTQALIQYGNFLSPNRNTPLEWFPTVADLRFAQIVLSADTYRFDASDLMPGEVGFGSFYRGITDWVEGADLETVLQEIDDSWPR